MPPLLRGSSFLFSQIEICCPLTTISANYPNVSVVIFLSPWI